MSIDDGLTCRNVPTKSNRIARNSIHMHVVLDNIKIDGAIQSHRDYRRHLGIDFADGLFNDSEAMINLLLRNGQWWSKANDIAMSWLGQEAVLGHL